MKNVERITDKLMLLTVSFSLPGQNRTDKEETAKVLEEHQASKDAGRWQTSLWPAKALDGIKSAQSQITNGLAVRAFRSGLRGVHIVPATAYEDVGQWLQKGLENRLEQVQKAASKLIEFKELAKASRNGLYREENYPANEQAFIAACEQHVHWLPYPTPDRFDVLGLANETAARLQVQQEERDREVIKDAMQSLWGRLYAPLAHMAQTLATNGDGRWKRTLLENVREIAGLVPALNVAGTAELDQFVSEIDALLSSTNYDELKESETRRFEVSKTASDIARRMSAYVA